MSKKKKNRTEDQACPCGGYQEKVRFEQCCGPYILGLEQAPDAERLMRSRYSAYVINHEPYLLSTWHATTQPISIDIETPPLQWLGLTIHEFKKINPDYQVVSFTVKYKHNGKAFIVHETSHFVKEDGQWLYIDGDVAE